LGFLARARGKRWWPPADHASGSRDLVSFPRTKRPFRRGEEMSAIQTQLVYCGDNLQKLRDLPDACVDLIYIDPPFNSNRNYEVFWGDTQEKRAFDDRFGAVEHPR
jgi:hypothetical protein